MRMHVQRASSYSNTKIQHDADLEEDRQALVEEQKASRARARQFSSETNRRKRILEERRKEDDVREQRVREDILQQRKQRVQEVTERFQRAHLPPAQRKRQVYRKQTPRLEEALEQIQGSFSSSSPYSPIYLRNPTNNRSHSSSPSSSAVSSSSRYQKQLSAAVAYAKLMQEKSGTNLMNSQRLFQHELQETQRLLEEQQDFQQEVRQLGQSESLSSLDSLENEEQNYISTANYQRPFYTSPEDHVSDNYRRPQSSRKHLNGMSSAAEMPFSKTESHDLWNQHSWTSANCQTRPLSNTTDESINNKCLNSKQQQETAHNRRDAHFDHQCPNAKESFYNDHIPLALNTNVSCNPCGTEPRLTTAVQDKLERHNDLVKGGLTAIPSKAWSTPDPTPRETLISTQEGQPESIQQIRNPSVHFSSQPIATQVILPSSHSKSEADTNNTSAPPSTLQETINHTESTHVKPVDKVIPIHCTKGYESSSVTAKNCSVGIANHGLKSEKVNDADIPDHVPKSFQVNINDTPTAGEQIRTDKSPSYSSSLHSKLISAVSETKNEKKIIKGILKKQSKYVTLNGGSVVFGKQIGVSIRDSVELTKQKEKESENVKTKKKLKWFDEIAQGNEDKEEMGEDEELANQNQAKNSQVKSNLNNPSAAAKHHQGQFQTATMTTTPEATQVMTSVASTGYHFTKQAWADSKGQDSKLQEQNEASPRKGRQKVPRRARSARARLGSAASKTRKGAIFRPQSAGEAVSVVKSQGKIFIPHPPPKILPSEDKQLVTRNGETVIKPPRTLYTDIYSGSKGSMPVEHASYKDIPDDCSLPQGNSFTSSAVTFTPFPPSYTVSAYETVTKATYMANTVETVTQQKGLNSSLRRGPVYGESGLRVDHTPTDEEITKLWQGVRSALTSKDDDSQSFAAHNGLLSNLHQPRPNLSHLTIDGGSLMNGVKSVTRMGGFFVSPSNTAVNRRKQIMDSNGTKHRALLEQRRQTVGSATRKPALNGQGSVRTVQISPFPSNFEPVSMLNPDQVSESTAQFLLAENLAHTSTADSEILAAMETVQTQKHKFLQHRAQHLGLSALSMEEQKLLQSLDRLNHRLLHVQDACGWNPSATGVLQITSLFVINQGVPAGPATRSGEMSVAARYRNRSASADNRTRLQRRY
ncbi:centrosomal protein of 126 kDa-like [Acipenser oxyrinchus oxyrinchus]|uniref:Centrosomal protein of 126 kDa-like n=1 Tax=Acipenser oxyrinchus oxyrinchus TaxID=40147 RepID=A0AAD8DJ22_ACIOX|nr:centrosomal protein of 126 kDa-like [Acipenser oxyrinchus oxyrinchus]